jgi:hypothetical protein
MIKVKDALTVHTYHLWTNLLLSTTQSFVLCPEDGASRFLQHVSECPPEHTTSHPRRQHSSIIHAVCLELQKQIRNAILKTVYCFYINNLFYNYLQNCSHHIPVPIEPILLS